MITATVDILSLEKDFASIIGYSEGFLKGVESGKGNFLKNLGSTVLEIAYEFIDSNAKVDPSKLHHVYEWYKTGSPAARLYDISFISDEVKISFKSTFKRSQSMQDGSNIPFWNKAEVMETGAPVTVKPRGQNPLVFQDGGDTIFTKAPVTIENPGGIDVQGSYKEVFNLFFDKYLTQSFLRSSGIINYIEYPKDFKTGLAMAKSGGSSKGFDTGYKWISKAGTL